MIISGAGPSQFVEQLSLDTHSLNIRFPDLGMKQKNMKRLIPGQVVLS